MNQFKRFIYAIGILLLPMGLILIQPDLGTASVYIPIFLTMCFIAGIPVKYILYVLSFGILTVFFTVLPVWNEEIADKPLVFISVLTNLKLRALLISSVLLITLLGYVVRRYFHGPKYIYWITLVFSVICLSLIFSMALGKFLKDYQIKRLIIFMNPNKDRLGAGWNIIQSKVAIGAGGMTGQGYLQ